MFVVGLTGGIGSGKTAASDHFAQLGIEIIDADIASRVVVEPGTPALKQIADHFGADILLSDQSLDRASLRQKIFANPEDKQWLENLLHPLIAEEIFRSINQVASPYALFVSPLLIESGQDIICDRLLVIDVPESVQLERTIKRDSNDAEQVQRIMASQASREQRLTKATDVIENTAGIEHLQQQVETLHQQFLLLAAAKTKSNEQ
ncbi:dephospho-CoA kinase [Oceanicoccus sp. KOV_DT_Chl]|uniref:dephospho-CoA kinase n=1 Tax=Oceanicoccus sp. KOV_DT_Chl TaxID=1904639 RepID=UPI000C7E491E|nr:dephospho-CoA kinase [Oceanicoccus sp. KOV_DT_Chl]